MPNGRVLETEFEFGEVTEALNLEAALRRRPLAAWTTGGWHVFGGATGSLGGAEGRKALPLAYDI
jgi:hypothetical protein